VQKAEPLLMTRRASAGMTATEACVNAEKECRNMSDAVKQIVQSKYASVAKSGLSTSQAGVRAVAEAFGYTPEQLASIPAEANMGVSCGNPTAFASLKPGETVVDLGSGGGLDVFLAAKRVGPTGRAIGIDMTPEMLDLARRNAAKADGGQPMRNAEFHQATIDSLPLPDASVDCVISNCVINLAPDKQAVFREIARVLKRGGRLAASDIALKKPLPAELGSSIAAYVGCIAGAIPIEEYRARLIEAGFAQVEVIDSGSDLNAYAKVENLTSCCSPGKSSLPIASASCCCAPDASDLHQRLGELLQRHNVNDYAASVRVFAVKPS
jgi:arsenite methyltransferase